MQINKNKLAKIISRFRNKNIMVVGDLVLDHYIFGKVDRVSPEAPVPVVWRTGKTLSAAERPMSD
jgi:bifunctional ADP-heptose synthase (sugar kinase/adenylyltransferase)